MTPEVVKCPPHAQVHAYTRTHMHMCAHITHMHKKKTIHVIIETYPHDAFLA